MTDLRDLTAISHELVTRVDVVVDGTVGATLQAVAGEVVEEERRAVRRRATLTAVDPDGDLTRDGAEALLAPTGVELAIWRGARDGSDSDLAQLGVLRVTDFTVDDSGGGVQVSISAQDRARIVRRNIIIDPYTVNAGSNYADAIRDLIADRYPAAKFDFEPTSETTPQIVVEGDAWGEARSMAEAYGAEVFFDERGICRLRPVPDPDDDPIERTLYEGEDAVITELSREVSDDEAFNRVVVTAQGSVDPVAGEATDDNPASPTYIAGGYGIVTKEITDTRVSSASAAQSAAEGRLRKLLGLVEQVSVSAVPDPTLRVGHIVAIRRSRVGVDARYAVDRVTMPLDAGSPMTLRTRRRRL